MDRNEEAEETLTRTELTRRTAVAAAAVADGLSAGAAAAARPEVV